MATTTTRVPLTKNYFSADELKALHAAAHRVWAYIAPDLMSALDEKGKSSIPRSHVLEVVIDAGRLSEALSRSWSGKPADQVSLATRDKFNALTYDGMLRALKPAFPFSRYE